jgi:hypothetical protein
MKKNILLTAVALLLSFCAVAQQQLAFPFQGGKDVMTRFFKDSITVSPQIIAKKATGTAVFKFTADEKGTIRKIIIYYADDLLLTQPLIAALQKSNHKWIIPDHEKFHDFIATFVISFKPPVTATPAVQKAVYEFYRTHKPFLSYDQVPLDMATLLPTVLVNYDVN